MERRHVIEVSAQTAAPPAAVWALLADVTTWTTWAGFATAGYEREGTLSPHGLGAIRRLAVGPFRSREEVLAFEPERHFAYDYVGTLPFRSYRGDVYLTRTPEGTRITWRASFEVGRVGGVVLHAFVRGLVGRTAARLAAAAATSPVPVA